MFLFPSIRFSPLITCFITQVPQWETTIHTHTYRQPRVARDWICSRAQTVGGSRSTWTAAEWCAMDLHSAIEKGVSKVEESVLMENGTCQKQQHSLHKCIREKSRWKKIIFSRAHARAMIYFSAQYHSFKIQVSPSWSRTQFTSKANSAPINHTFSRTFNHGRCQIDRSEQIWDVINYSTEY